MNKEIKTIEAYNKIADDYSKRNYQHFWVDEYKYFKSILPGKRVIDLGCGAGRDAELFVKDRFDYLGVDASEKMLKIAKERSPEGHFRLLDLRDLDLPVSYFDGFWASASLLHFPKVDIPEILNSFYNLLKPEGVGFISIKNKKNLDEGFIKEEKFGGIERYFSFFEKTEMEELITNIGFTIIKSHKKIEKDDFKTEWLCFFIRK